VGRRNCDFGDSADLVDQRDRVRVDRTDQAPQKHFRPLFAPVAPFVQSQRQEPSPCPKFPCPPGTNYSGACAEGPPALSTAALAGLRIAAHGSKWDSVRVEGSPEEIGFRM
jgi:hypothetical protein